MAAVLMTDPGGRGYFEVQTRPSAAGVYLVRFVAGRKCTENLKRLDGAAVFQFWLDTPADWQPPDPLEFAYGAVTMLATLGAWSISPTLH